MTEDMLFLKHLVQSAVLTADQYKALLDEQRRIRTASPRTTFREALRDALRRLGQLDDAAFIRHWVAFLNLPQPDLAAQPPSDAAIAALSRDLCLRYTALPLELTPDHATIVMADPTNSNHITDFQFLLNRAIRPAFAPAEAIRAAIERYCPEPDPIY